MNYEKSDLFKVGVFAAAVATGAPLHATDLASKFYEIQVTPMYQYSAGSVKFKPEPWETNLMAYSKNWNYNSIGAKVSFGFGERDLWGEWKLLTEYGFVKSAPYEVVEKKGTAPETRKTRTTDTHSIDLVLGALFGNKFKVGVQYAIVGADICVDKYNGGKIVTSVTPRFMSWLGTTKVDLIVKGEYKNWALSADVGISSERMDGNKVNVGLAASRRFDTTGFFWEPKDRRRDR